MSNTLNKPTDNQPTKPSNSSSPPSSSTSTKSKKTVQVIVGEIGRDSKTGILGRGYSYDNGKTFHVLDTMYGRLYGDDDIEAIWINGVSNRVKSEVNSATAEIPAVESAANEGVRKAENAIASSKVNSDAIVAQSEAISEAKAAMDSATAEIQQTAANAASDAAKIRADVAQVQSEVDTAKASNSASVEALKSDVSAAKQDLADVHDSLTKAQAAAEESQKAIDNSIAQINSDIEQDRKDIASAQQANDDTAKQLDTYSKQAQDQGKTIKSIQDKQDGFTATLADVQGNVTQVSDKVDGLSASLKDAQDNVASIKAQADQLSATLTDHAKSIATLTASAKELSSTLEDTDGRLSKVEQTAQTNSSTLSDVQGDLSQVKQDATTLTATLKDAQGNISTLQQKADSVSAKLASAQGDIASLQTDVTGIKATLVSHEGDIHTLQADSKSLHDSMQDAQGDISTLKKTSTDVTSELKDHDGRMSKVEQTASTLTNEFSDQQGRLNKVEQTAQGTQQTVANQQGQINNIKTDASGIHETLTGQGNQIATINVTLNGLSSKYEGVEKSSDELKNRLNNLSVGTRNLLHDTSDQYRTLDGDGRLEKSTASDIYTSVANYHGGDYFTYAATITNPSTKNAMLEVCLLDANKNPLSASGQAYPVLVHSDSVAPGIWNIRENISFRITSNTWFIRTYVVFDGDNAPVGSQVQVKDERLVEGSMAGTWSPNPDDVADKITTNSTQIDQNKKAITLKADQTTVDNLSGEVSQNSAQLKVQAGQISSKVSSTDFTALNNKAMQNRGTVNSPDFNSLTQAGYYTVTNPINGKNFPTGNWGTLEVSGQVSDINGRLNQKYVGDNGGGTYTRQYNASAKSWTGWLKEANQNDVTALSNRITTNSTQITQNKQAIALKASQADVDTLNNTVKSQSASLSVLNNQIATKVTSADVEKAIDGKGYVTKDFVESSITQKANTLSESIAKNDGQIQNITASIDGLQSTVKGKADMSKVTQLADALQFKVTGVYIAQTDLLKLTKNDVASESVLTGPQLNNLASVVKGTKVQLSFDYVTDSDIGFYPILTGAPNEFVGSYPFGAETIYAQKGVKGTYSKTITVNDGWVDSKETNLAFAAFNNGTITFTNLVLKLADSTKGDAQSMFNIMQDQMNLRVTKDNLISQINLSAGNTLIQSNKIFLDADSVVFSKNSKAFIPSAAITNLEADKITTGTLNGVEIRQLETGGRSIDIKNGNIAITSHDPYEPRISFTNDGKNMKMFNALGDLEVINQEFSLFNFTPDDTSSTNPIPFFRVVNTGNTGSGSAHLYMDHAIIDGNEWWTPAGGITFGRTWDGTNASSDYVDLYAKSFVPHSELSAKTRIKKLDRKEALDKIMQDDMYTYQFKEDVRDGVSKRYASFIIDNVHDVAQYAEPEEFLSANGKGRDDGTQLAYLIAAVQYQQEQIEELKKKLEEK